MSRTGKKIPPTLWAEGFQFNDFRRTIDCFDGARMFDGLAFEATHRTIIVVRIQFAALLSGELLPQLLSHSLTNIVAELFDRAKAGGLQINVSAADPFSDEFLGKSIDHCVER